MTDTKNDENQQTMKHRSESLNDTAVLRKEVYAAHLIAVGDISNAKCYASHKKVNRP